MAARRNSPRSDEQLDLFSTQRPTHDTVDTIRPDGRETLARTPPEDGARTGANGTPAPDASGGGGKDEGRNGHAANGVDAAGVNGATSPRPGLGDGEGEIHPAPARRIAKRHQEELPKNLNNHRITEADRLGFKEIYVSKYGMKGIDTKRFGIRIYTLGKVEELKSALFT